MCIVRHLKAAFSISSWTGLKESPLKWGDVSLCHIHVKTDHFKRSCAPWAFGKETLGAGLGRQSVGSSLLCADPAAGRDLILHTGLGWAQSFIHTADPLELPRGVERVYSAFSTLLCPTSLLPSRKALFVHHSRGGCTSVLNEWCFVKKLLGFLNKQNFGVTVDKAVAYAGVSTGDPAIREGGTDGSFEMPFPPRLQR